MRLALFVSLGMFTYSIYAQQQQQFSNAMLLNNSNPGVQSVQNNSNRNFVNVTALNVQSNRTNQRVQVNKTNSTAVKNTSTVRSSNKNNTSRVVRQVNRRNSNRVGGPNTTGNLGNFNPNDNNVGNTNDDKIVTNVLDNNDGNQFNPQSQTLENNEEQIQTQQAATPAQSFVNENKESKSLNLSLDLSASKRAFSSSSSSSSSVKANRRTFHKKYSKLKRNFYGKMYAHKKSRHQVDICFNWR